MKPHLSIHPLFFLFYFVFWCFRLASSGSQYLNLSYCSCSFSCLFLCCFFFVFVRLFFIVLIFICHCPLHFLVLIFIFILLFIFVFSCLSTPHIFFCFCCCCFFFVVVPLLFGPFHHVLHQHDLPPKGHQHTILCLLKIRPLFGLSKKSHLVGNVVLC